MEHEVGAKPMLPPGTTCDQFVLQKMLSGGGFGQIFEASIYGSSNEKSVVKVEGQNAMVLLIYFCFRGGFSSFAEE